jgi:hypothetical protein
MKNKRIEFIITWLGIFIVSLVWVALIFNILNKK